MATIQTIATTLLADARPFARGFTDAERSAEKLGGKMEILDRQFRAKTASMERSLAGGGRGRNMASGFLELSRGLEDAAVGFDVNGLSGAVRGASNNLTAFATLAGGPVAGAIAGLAAASLPSLVNMFFQTENAAEKARKALEDFGNQSKRQQDEARQQAQFAGMIGGLESSDDVKKQIEQREQQLREIEAQERVLQQQRDAESAARNQAIQAGVHGFGVPGTIFGKATGQDLFGNNTEKLEKSFERDKKIHEDQMKLLEERTKAEEELNLLFDKRNDLREQEMKFDELGKLEGQAEVNRKKAEERERLFREDEQRLLGMLNGPNGSGSSSSTSSGRLASVATADSQAMLRTQYQAREAAERRKEAAQQKKLLEDMLRELREGRRENREDSGEDVNLT